MTTTITTSDGCQPFSIDQLRLGGFIRNEQDIAQTRMSWSLSGGPLSIPLTLVVLAKHAEPETAIVTVSHATWHRIGFQNRRNMIQVDPVGGDIIEFWMHVSAEPRTLDSDGILKLGDLALGNAKELSRQSEIRTRRGTADGMLALLQDVADAAQGNFSFLTATTVTDEPGRCRGIGPGILLDIVNDLVKWHSPYGDEPAGTRDLNSRVGIEVSVKAGTPSGHARLATAEALTLFYAEHGEEIGRTSRQAKNRIDAFLKQR